SIFGGSDGSIDLIITGGTSPFQYEWSNGELSEDINNLIAGMYSVIVTDSESQIALDTIHITEPDMDNGNTVIDFDGNIYSTVKIGDQWWMAENLKTTHTSDGSILNGVYAYNDDENYIAEYGRLYTWYAALNANPPGWHLPSDEEWDIMETTLGSEAGTKLKVGGSSGFNAKLAGYRYDAGGYADIDYWGVFWTSTPSTSDHSYVRNLFSDRSHIISSGMFIEAAGSVRFIKD
ncbi:FISUMP domain-containing protein, partial [Candidatus Neomarinimicrobiota bacterium]